jgi:hypothetical protein
MPLGHSQTATSAKDRALAFIKDVVQPDMSKYNVTLISDIVGHPLNQSSVTQEGVDYRLNANGNGPDIICMFTNNVLTSAVLSTNTGASSTILSSNPSETLNAKAQSVMQGYQTYTGENLQDMTTALSSIDATQNTTKVLGTTKVTVQTTQTETDVYLKYVANGTAYTGISFTIENGQFYSFSDDRSLWTIGNTNMNINQSQAISIAQQFIQNYSYTLENGGVVAAPYNITSIQASTNFYPRDNSTTIYPYWSVQFNLGQLYPGNVYALSIGVWADSGNVFLSQPVGVEGGAPPVTPSATGSQQTQPQGQKNMLPELGIIAGVVTIVAIAGIAVFIRKRSK